MLVAAAVCPHPPILVPELAGGAASELDPLRAACDTALGRVCTARPDHLAVVGGAPATEAFGPDASGTFAGYGTDVRVGPGEPELPLSLTVGRWLAERAAPGVRIDAFQAVAADAPEGRCRSLGAELAGRAPRVALLVLGDGAACHDPKAPGRFDAGAGPYDDAVGRALATGDAAALAGLDPRRSAELLVAGRAAWQVLAGACGAHRMSAELLAYQRPYGVGYFVAAWSRDGAGVSGAR